MHWSVYILLSETNGFTYVGVTTDLPRRLRQHNGEQAGGARSTRSGRPWAVQAVHGPYASRARAQQVEHQIKRLKGIERLDWREPIEDAEESSPT